MPNVITDVDQFIEGNKRKDLTMEDYQAVVEGCTACKVVGAAIRNFTGKVVYGTENSTDTVVRGWTPSMGPIYDLDVVMGRPLNDSDQNNASAVVVIGQDIRENLMAGTDPLGKEIRVDGHDVHGDRRRQERRQDAGAEPRQLRDHADQHVVQGLWLAQ